MYKLLIATNKILAAIFLVAIIAHVGNYTREAIWGEGSNITSHAERAELDLY